VNEKQINIFNQTKGMDNQFSPKIAGFRLFSPEIAEISK